ncbi:hypothetical protein J6590_101113 [Homalodisca vitripennis]|nr:hypothetical protein J6590_101113 [Homalodisca vitripennis]
MVLFRGRIEIFLLPAIIPHDIHPILYFSSRHPVIVIEPILGLGTVRASPVAGNAPYRVEFYPMILQKTGSRQGGTPAPTPPAAWGGRPPFSAEEPHLINVRLGGTRRYSSPSTGPPSDLITEDLKT